MAEKKIIADRIARLRNEMEKRGVDIYIIPTADDHDSEYVGEYFKAREFLTGFTGSAGTAVVTADEVGLWTDARYFLQAKEQLDGTKIVLYRMGEENVPSIFEYLESNLKEQGTLGFYGRTVSAKQAERYEQIAEKKNGSIYAKEDLVDLVWRDRPQLLPKRAWILDEAYAGASVEEKLKKVREAMEEKNAGWHLLTTLDDICWLLNVRGDDICYVPVVLSYLAIGREQCLWFVHEQAVGEEVLSHLKKNGIEPRPYEEFYAYVAGIPEGTRVWLDRETINAQVCYALSPKIQLIDAQSPLVLQKAVKNPVQLDNIKKAHIKDGVAMCRFMYWLKTNVGRQTITELSASEYLAALRGEQEGFIEQSFETISGYRAHGAIVHYAATKDTDVELEPEGFLLLDSGGHYLEGTTDVTRTFALGALTPEMKADFTRVCRANLNLADARFLKGCTGQNLDILARTPLWEAGLDYKHGTGHGVGYLLNVHEGPNAFRFQSLSGRSEHAVLEEGMVTTDEPGIYREGLYGIRTENELVCREGIKNAYGRFMYFENITYVPIDLDAIDVSQMSRAERQRLNRYHALVYAQISPYLEGEELEFLKMYTREI